MKIGIIGVGVVGKTIHLALDRAGYITHLYDKNLPGYQDLHAILACDGVFICVPTDLINDHCDLTHVSQQMEFLAQHRYTGEIVIKSTVLPGTTANFINQYPDLKITVVPEFLRQDHALEDFCSAEVPVYVGTNSRRSFEFVSALHKSFDQDLYQVSPTEAEMIKYFSNVFNATRIVFANIFSELCDLIDVKYQNVLDAAVKLPNIQSDLYLKCNEHLRGYSGKCLPKDIVAFNTFLRDHGIAAGLFDSVIEDNKKYAK